MIKDNLKNADNYCKLSDNLTLGFEWLKNQDLKTIKDGRYEISGKVYANVQTYETKEIAPFEAHRKYIDIQYMIQGHERIGITDYFSCSTVEKYDSERDLEFLSATKSDTLTLSEGEFLIFYPNDAHQPSLMLGQKEIVKKVVVKVPV